MLLQWDAAIKNCAADLSIWGGGGAKKGNSKGRDHEGLGRVCLNHAIRYLRFYRVECVFASIELKKKIGPFFFLFFAHYIKPTKRFPVVSCH